MSRRNRKIKLKLLTGHNTNYNNNTMLTVSFKIKLFISS